MKSTLVNLLENSIRSSQGTRIERLKKNPKKTLSTMTKIIITYIASRLQVTFQVRCKTFWGDEMTCVPPEAVSESIFEYGYFEEGLTRMVLEYLKPQMTFCDIGAHLGYYTLLGSHIVGENGQVHSFEPIPSTFSFLCSNTTGRNNITINNCAVFSNETSISLNDYGLMYSGFNSFTRARLPPKILNRLTPRKIDMPAIPFDKYVNDNNIRPDFIKIDVEGAEYEVLLGMKKTLADIRPIVSLEVGDMGIKGIEPSRELIKYLVGQGYQAYGYNGKGIVKHQLRDRYDYDNILFLPISDKE